MADGTCAWRWTGVYERKVEKTSTGSTHMKTNKHTHRQTPSTHTHTHTLHTPHALAYSDQCEDELDELGCMAVWNITTPPKIEGTREKQLRGGTGGGLGKSMTSFNQNSSSEKGLAPQKWVFRFLFSLFASVTDRSP